MQDSGQMTWAQAVAGPLAGATCLWQDLDGLHVEPAPQVPPPTSILWGWRDDSLLARVRLDGHVAFVAVHDPGASAGSATVPWNFAPGEDGRVAAVRGPAVPPVGSWIGRYEQIVVDGDGAGTGPVTFIRPAPSRSTAEGPGT